MAHFDENPALAQQLRSALIVQAKRASTGQPGTNGHSAHGNPSIGQTATPGGVQ